MKKKIAAVLLIAAGLAAAIKVVIYKVNVLLAIKEIRINKFQGYFNLFDQWMTLKEKGLSITKYFEDHNYHNIAVYGMGVVGNHLLEDLKSSGVTVSYAIDKKAGEICSDIRLLTLEDELPEVDVIVVTATFAFDEIEKSLREVVGYPIVSLDEVVYESCKEELCRRC